MAGIAGVHYKYLAFACVSGDLSSGPHVYVVSTLIAEPSLLSLSFSVVLGLLACITMTGFKMWHLEWSLGFRACSAVMVPTKRHPQSRAVDSDIWPGQG